MSSADEIDLLAAEYVLGTLAADERAMVAARRQREPALSAAIDSWEQKLAPLNTRIDPIQPLPGTFARIEQRISGAASVASASADGNSTAATVVELSRRVTRWKSVAAAMSAMAASLLMFVGVRETQRAQEPRNLVAVLQKDAASPAFLVSVDLDTKMLTVRPVAAEPLKGQSYELWIVHDSLKTPKSLGVIDDRDFMVRPTLAAYDPDVIETATLAVSLEPEGGSKTGAPTGPVVFAGKLIQSSK